MNEEISLSELTAAQASEKKPLILPPAEVSNPLWLSVSECAKLAGLGTKTIRRGLDSHKLIFKVVGNRYLINSADLIAWLLQHTKLRNKFLRHGFGQYVDKWKN